MAKVAEDARKQYQTVEEDDAGEMDVAWDDVSGASLDPKAVKAARAEEIDYVRRMKLYTKVLISECTNKTGKKSTRHYIDKPGNSARRDARSACNI